MGSVNNVDDRGSDVMSALSPENNNRDLKPSVSKHNSSDKLLTLPTILTIGRVVAIPVIVSSTLFVVCLMFMRFVVGDFFSSKIE